MYLRITKGRTNNYLVLVEGYRDENGKSKQRTICNFGKVSDENNDKILTLGKNILEKFGATAILKTSQISEKSRKNFGAYKILKKIWNIYKFDKFWDEKLKSRKLEYNFKDTLGLMIMGRISSPSSKLELFENQDQYEGFETQKLQNIYKSLDELDLYQEDIKEHIFNKQIELNGKAFVTFFDVTTLYFESKVSDGFREFGFSKDCKFNDVQIVLSILSDQNGNPLTFDLFPGNMFEGNTMKVCLERLKNKYDLKKLIIVADRGMYNKNNLNMIEKMGFEYIVGCKLRSCSKEIKENVFLDDYRETISENTDFKTKYKIIEKTPGESVVVVHSQKRALKDSKDRQRLIEKALKIVDSSQCVDTRGGKKYVKQEKSKKSIDHDKIEKDIKWDGYYGISHNCKKLSGLEVLSAYHNLWKIEDSFRMMKNYFETRPMFHWTKKRICAHITLNFISYVFEKYIENTINIGLDGDKKISANKIRKGINGMNKSYIQAGNSCFDVPAKLSDISILILNKLSIAIPSSCKIK